MPPKLQCPSCGAALIWKGVAPVVECRYCGTHVATGTGEETSQPADARSQKVDDAQGWRGAGAIFVAVALFIAVGATVGICSNRVSPGGRLKGAEVDLQALSMAMTRDQALETTGAQPFSDDGVCIWFREGLYEYVCLGWDEDHADHVESFSFHHAKADSERGAAALGRLKGQMGRRLYLDDDGDGTFRWGGASATAYADGSALIGHADPDDADWQPRLQHLWLACLAAAFDRNPDLEPEANHRWLAGEQPLGVVRRIDLTWDVDRAQTAVREVIVGAAEDRLGGLRYSVSVTHPWIGQVDFRWPNKAGATLQSIDFKPPPGQATFPDVQDVRQCVEAVLGDGHAEETDHLAGKVRYSWNPEGLSVVTLYPEYLGVAPYDWHGNPPDTDLWFRLLTQLDDCAD